MAQLLLGVFLLGLLYFAGRYFIQADAKSLATGLRQFGGVLLCGIGLILIFSGRFALIALPVILGGLAVLFGWKLPFTSGLRRTRFQGRTSRVKTAFFDMELQHSTGEMDGVVRKGAFENRPLSSLSPGELKALYGDVTREGMNDVDSLSLLETYLDGVLAGWREDFHVNDDPRHGRAARPGAISEEEAYEILGLERGASLEEIRAAHRRLMLKLHPDRGGSTVLAAKINEAKDILVRIHSSGS